MRNQNRHPFIALAVGLGLLPTLLWLVGYTQPAHADPGTLYVAPDGHDGYNCASITNRCRTVQRAIDIAEPFDEIRVATGIYTNTASPVADIYKTVTLLGGWSDSFTTRDPNTYPTTLDAQRDERVVYISGHISPTIDGFTITGGDASDAT